MKKIVLNKNLFRSYRTMDQIAKQLKRARSAIDAAFTRLCNAGEAIFEVKQTRTGKRGPLTNAYRVRR